MQDLVYCICMHWFDNFDNIFSGNSFHDFKNRLLSFYNIHHISEFKNIFLLFPKNLISFLYSDVIERAMLPNSFVLTCMHLLSIYHEKVEVARSKS